LSGRPEESPENLNQDSRSLGWDLNPELQDYDEGFLTTRLRPFVVDFIYFGAEPRSVRICHYFLSPRERIKS
jgi:hypothetical protein